MNNARRRRRFDALAGTIAVLLAASQMAVARAESHRYQGGNATYRAECGSCHIPYPPTLLSSESWRTLMAGLDRHFGSDASVSDAQRAELTAYLESAGNRRRGSTTIRITESSWFRAEHAEVAGAWKRPSVKSASNCEACHLQANAGDFSEHNILVPR
jgi:nitrate/TMAO reductase-like tetraheme cytochrome c subunit